MAELRVDVVIFGGGVTGLWLLDHLHARGYRALLLEANALGAGQTIASQGILHGGVKYALAGLVTSSARAVSSMPDRWRRALAGETAPDLLRVRRRAEFCHLWQTNSLTSRLGMFGARATVTVRPAALSASARPPALAQCPGAVARIDEQVIDPESLLTVMADPHWSRILQIDARSGLEFECDGPGRIRRVRLIDPASGAPVDLAPDRIVLAAGAGNAELREHLGLPGERMQLRPLHMVMVRSPSLPAVNGHCIDGAHTRVTITAARDAAERTVWQVGGAVAEHGVELGAPMLVDHARSELLAVLPGLELSGAEFATYAVDRAEAAASGRRPADVAVIDEDDVVTVWPTKLVLAPRAADRVTELLAPPAGHADPAPAVSEFARPSIALLPWEESRTWIRE